MAEAVGQRIGNRGATTGAIAPRLEQSFQHADLLRRVRGKRKCRAKRALRAANLAGASRSIATRTSVFAERLVRSRPVTVGPDNPWILDQRTGVESSRRRSEVFIH
jgi:hypothetical protein